MKGVLFFPRFILHCYFITIFNPCVDFYVQFMLLRTYEILNKLIVFITRKYRKFNQLLRNLSACVSKLYHQGVQICVENIFFFYILYS